MFIQSIESIATRKEEQALRNRSSVGDVSLGVKQMRAMIHVLPLSKRTTYTKLLRGDQDFQ